MNIEDTEESELDRVRKWTIISQLIALGMFEKSVILGTYQILIVHSPWRERREAVFQSWLSQTSLLEWTKGYDPYQMVLTAMIKMLDDKILRKLIDHAQSFGVGVTYARLLEAALQETTEVGEQFVRVSSAKKRSATEPKSLVWEKIYTMLTEEGWDPFQIPKSKLPPE